MNKAVFYIVIFLIVSYTFGQNLVPNPSFEEIVSCPTSIGQIEATKYWFRPTDGSTDYFNECGSFGASVPNNALGYQPAKTGVGYVGLITYVDDPTVINEREYLAVKLSAKLTGGEKYFWCFWISLGGISKYATNNMGIGLTNNLVTDLSSIVLLDIPSYGVSSEVVTDSISWTIINGSFVANGGEQYLYIGNFSSDFETSILEIEDATPFPSKLAYYYIDDVYIGSLPCEKSEQSVLIPNVFTPNNDGINDLFLTHDNNLVNKEIQIFNRWGNIVFTGKNEESWDGTVDGIPCSEGIYFVRISFYNVNSKVIDNKSGFIHLIR